MKKKIKGINWSSIDGRASKARVRSEIELLLKTTLLDIEFGITKANKIIIFQVRPITSIQHSDVEKFEFYKINKFFTII